jgi:hypothetical protein
MYISKSKNNMSKMIDLAIEVSITIDDFCKEGDFKNRQELIFHAEKTIKEEGLIGLCNLDTIQIVKIRIKNEHELGDLG